MINIDRQLIPSSWFHKSNSNIPLLCQILLSTNVELENLLKNRDNFLK